MRSSDPMSQKVGVQKVHLDFIQFNNVSTNFSAIKVHPYRRTNDRVERPSIELSFNDIL